MSLTVDTPIVVHPMNLFSSIVTHQEGEDGTAFLNAEMRHHQFDEVEGYPVSMYTQLPDECHFMKLPNTGWVVYDNVDETLHALICDSALTFDEVMAGVNAMVDLCTTSFNIGRHRAHKSVTQSTEHNPIGIAHKKQQVKTTLAALHRYKKSTDRITQITRKHYGTH